MRLKKVLVSMICTLFVVTMAANAMATLWSTTDGNLNVYIWDSGDDEFAIFDGADLTNQLSSLQSGYNTISLNTDQCFEFARKVNDNWSNDYTIISSSSNNDAHTLVWMNDDQFLVIDAKPECNPVPLPAAGYLLVAGMAGLISTRKFKKH